MKKFFNQLYIVTRAIIVISPVALLIWLVRQDLVTTGTLQFNYDFSKLSPSITELFPANRLSEVFHSKQGGFWQNITQEPVYFEVRLPQKFEHAEVEVAFLNPSQNLFQLGLKTLGEGDFNYYFKPLDNKILNNLDWYRLEDSRGTLWQRNKQFLNLDQFLEEKQALNGLSAYGFDLGRKFIMPAYQPDNKIRVYDKTLRGEHSFYTYLKNEPINFTFTIQDINRSDGPDPFVIKAYNSEGELADIVQIPDDGYISKKDPATDKRNIWLYKDSLPEGVYRIEIEADDDILVREISTTNRYLTFINRLYLADNLEYADGLTDIAFKPTAIYSTIPRLGFETSHPEGLQTVGLGANQSIALKETHRNYFVTPDQLPTTIISPLNDLKIFGRGLMSLTEESYFNPEIYDLSDAYLSDESDFLISSYALPKNMGGWQVNKVNFDLSNAQINNRKLRFALSAPELNDSNSEIAIKYIKVVLTKKPFACMEIIKKAIKYIRDCI